MGTINIDEGLAALIATAAALLSAYINIRATKTAAHLAAKQNIVGDDLQELSTALYEVVALSVEAINSKDPDRFQEKIEQAAKVSKKLDDLRRRHRYSLPFVFDPLWYLKGLPIYVSHYRNSLDDPRLQKMKIDATELRLAIDKSLEQYFFAGKAPGAVSRWNLKRLGRRLERTFKDGRPTN
ncbi:hypothetical protein [Pseudophaeobacter sp.]|uniref:hypothetical protein n=1 Tax=Pseudophaeobacter sp. TaxID=1971739 RepID=UPI003A983571